jgi:glycosyltransferase involved in cell wall biosynthesis
LVELGVDIEGTMARPLNILCWGTYDTGKPRARLLLKGLRLAGASVSEYRADIWQGIEDKSQIKGWSRRLGLLFRWLASYPHLLWRLGTAPKPDVVLIGFPGVLDILLAAPIARFRGIPLAWDMFMSLYDTIVEDRRMLRPGGLPARLLRALESFALRRADLVFLDTQAHARRVERLFRLRPDSMDAVWVGVESEHFQPQPAPSPPTENVPSDSTQFRVLFYGQFIPLHGIAVIIEAARLTQGEPVTWQIIGQGQESQRIQRMLDEQPLQNLSWEQWVDYSELHRRIAQADACLGIFGDSEKAASVIPNKVFQIVAMQRPVITRDSPAIRELLEHSPPCVTLIPPNDPVALADAVRQMARTARPLGPCHGVLRHRIGAEAIGHQCIDVLSRHFPRKA